MEKNKKTWWKCRIYDTGGFVAWPLDNVAENNTGLSLSCPSGNSSKGTNFNVKINSPIIKNWFQKQRSPEIKVSIFFEAKLGFEEVPNAEIGGAIVDDDGSGGTKEGVIGLALNFGDERHCVGETEEEVALVVCFCDTTTSANGEQHK